MKMGKSRKTQTTKADLIRPKNFNRPVTSKEIELVILHFSQKIAEGPITSLMNSIKHLKKN